MLNAGERVSKLSLLLAESYLLCTVCQPNELEPEIKKKLGGQTEGQPKIGGGIAHPAPLRIATDLTPHQNKLENT